MWFYSENKMADPRGQGNYSVRVEAPQGAKIEQRSWKDAKELWDQIRDKKPITIDQTWLEGGNGIMGISGKLPAKGKARIRVAVGWYFPNLIEQWHPEKNYGRMYSNWFKDSWEVRSVSSNRGRSAPCVGHPVAGMRCGSPTCPSGSSISSATISSR